MKLTDSQIVGMFVIAFPEASYPSGRIRITINIDTTQNAAGGPYSWVNYSAATLELRDVDSNKISWDFDDRENMMLLGQLECKIYDYQDNLGRMLTHPGLIKANTTIKFEYKKTGGAWTTEFEGIIDDESISNPPHSKIVSFSFSPNTEKLNDSATHIGSTRNNLLGTAYDDPNYVPALTKVIEDIYKIINPNITVTFFQNWTFKSTVKDNLGTVLGTPETNFSGLTCNFNNLFNTFRTVNGQRIYDQPLSEIQTYMMMLKALARSLGCFTGMLSQDQAYFGLFMSFLNDSSEYTTISEKQIKKNGYKKIISERLIKYLTLPIIGNAAATPVEVGTNTGLDNDKLDLPIFNSVYGQTYLGTGFLNGVYDYGSYEKYISEIKSPGIAYMPYEQFLAKYWGSYFLRPEVKRRDRITFSGVDSPVNKKHSYNGIVYQWLSIRKDYKKNETIIEEAIPIGTTTIADPPINTTKFTKILKVPNFKITINGVDYTGSGNSIITGGGVFTFSWDNMYNSGALSAEEYDGTVLTIAQADTDIWKTIEAYVLYIYVSGVTLLGPSSSYPTDNDSNGIWYRYITIRDQKITDNTYRYILRDRTINEKTKFAFWLGAKSVDAQLFENIGYYGGFLN